MNADYYRFENITIDGTTYDAGTLGNLSQADMEGLVAHAFSFGELTDDDVQVPGTDPLTADPETFVTLEPHYGGGAAVYVRIVLTQKRRAPPAERGDARRKGRPSEGRRIRSSPARR